MVELKELADQNAALATMLAQTQEAFNNQEVSEEEYRMLLADIRNAYELKQTAENLQMTAAALKAVDALLKLI